MSDKYILRDHEPIACSNLMEWAKWFQTADRIVAQTEVGRSKVSTVFLGLDHSFGGKKPLLFETMIFEKKGKGQSCEMERYSTWDEAERGHKLMCKLAKLKYG